jgi:N6-adenosine-specific RNA methylase IME4
MRKYKIIYADPPWNYCATGNTIPSRAKTGQPYVPMRMIDIYDFDLIHEIADKECVLFLWATAPLIPEAIYLLKCWGFEYKTIAFTWIKKNKQNKNSNFWGMGSWTRSNPEFCLLAVKGNPKSISHSVHSVIEFPIMEHSKKPDKIRDLIVELVGDLPRIELFARKKVEGWDAWGNEVPKEEQKVLNIKKEIEEEKQDE